MKYAVALDIGGTKIEGVLFNEKYKQIKKERVYFDKKESDIFANISRKKLLKLMLNLITDLRKDYKIEGVGINFPEVITLDGSISSNSKLKELSGFKLGKYLMKKIDTKIIIKNDADLFALAEAKFGAGKGKENIIGVIWGTGVGSGIVVNGKIYSGIHGSAGEFGHNIIDSKGSIDRFGIKGVVEEFTCGPKIVENYIKHKGKMENPNPKKIFESKEKIAKEVFNNAIDSMAKGLAQLFNILNPEILVIGGGLSNLPMYKELNKLTKKYTHGGIRANVKIVKNKLGDSAGVYGAAALIFDN